MILESPIHVLVNSSAGLAMSMGKDSVRDAIESVFGQNATVVIEDASTFFEHLHETITEDGPAMIVVGGGDGTISTAASWALKHNQTLGVLPFGTLNLVARALGIPMNLQDALLALADSGLGAIDVGYVNGEAFFNHCSIGIHPRLVKLREELPYDSPLSKIASGAAVLARATQSMRSYEFGFEGDFKTFRAETILALISVNPVPNSVGQLPFRPGQKYEKLGLYVWPSSEGNEVLQIFMDLLLGKWSESTNAVHHETTSVTVHGEGNVHASIDGEVTLVSSPIRCTIKPRALSVLRPGRTNSS